MCIIEQQENELQEARGETNKITTEKSSSLVQINAAPQKLSNEKDKARAHSHQILDQCKELKQTGNKEKEPVLCHGNANDHLEQENRKDDDIGRQKSHTDDQFIQDGSKKNEKSDSVVERILENDNSQRKVQGILDTEQHN